MTKETFVWLAVFWLALSFLVGLAANMRNRDGIGWFALAILGSPFLIGALVLVLRRKEKPFGLVEDNPTPTNAGPPLLSTFKPDGIYAGITYMVTPDSAIIAATPNGLIRFRTIEDFIGAAEETPA